MLLDPDTPPDGVVENHLAVVLTSMMAWSALRPCVTPAVVAGHSLGLLSALHAADVLSAADAIRVTAFRATVTAREASAIPGRMAAVLAPAETAEAACADHRCWMVNDNTPQQTVISGTPEGLESAMSTALDLGARDVIPLEIDGAFHSPLMRGAVDDFADLLGTVVFAPQRLAVVHNAVSYPAGTRAPWSSLVANDLVRPVRWRQNQFRLADHDISALVEVGYGRTLTGLAKRTLSGIRLLNMGCPEDLAEVTHLVDSGELTRAGR